MRIAVFTQVFNEDLFLPVWLNHYGRLVGFDNIYVIDDGSDDGSTLHPTISNIVRKRRKPLDEKERSSSVSRYHAELLNNYDVVIYTDCDELLVIDPKLGISFAGYIKIMMASGVNCIRVIGFNVLHNVGVERDIDLNRSLFSQRHFAKFDFGYCKPLISKVPINWTAGFHESNLESRTAIYLFLFHLRSIDYNYSAQRIKTLNSIKFSDVALRERHGSHFRWTKGLYLKHLYGEPNSNISSAREMDLSDFALNQIKVPGGSNPVVRVPERFIDTIQLCTFSHNR